MSAGHRVHVKRGVGRGHRVLVCGPFVRFTSAYVAAEAWVVRVNFSMYKRRQPHGNTDRRGVRRSACTNNSNRTHRSPRAQRRACPLDATFCDAASVVLAGQVQSRGPVSREAAHSRQRHDRSADQVRQGRAAAVGAGRARVGGLTRDARPPRGRRRRRASICPLFAWAGDRRPRL